MGERVGSRTHATSRALIHAHSYAQPCAQAGRTFGASLSSTLCLMNRQLTAAALALVSVTASAEVHYLNPWEGLRDYDKRPAFTNRDPETIKRLSATVNSTRVSSKTCKVGGMKVSKDWTVPLRSNIC